MELLSNRSSNFSCEKLFEMEQTCLNGETCLNGGEGGGDVVVWLFHSHASELNYNVITVPKLQKLKTFWGHTVLEIAAFYIYTCIKKVNVKWSQIL